MVTARDVHHERHPNDVRIYTLSCIGMLHIHISNIKTRYRLLIHLQYVTKVYYINIKLQQIIIPLGQCK